MVWSFQHDNACTLSAVVPERLDPQTLASGYAARAPASLRAQAPAVQVAALSEPIAAPEPVTPDEMVSAPITTAADDGALLGGPEQGDLRLGLR